MSKNNHLLLSSSSDTKTNKIEYHTRVWSNKLQCNSCVLGEIDEIYPILKTTIFYFCSNSFISIPQKMVKLVHDAIWIEINWHNCKVF
jgi:hypothetical protein